MSYKIRPEDRQYIEEFRKTPVGHHSPGLQRLLNVLRGGPIEGKHVLIRTKPNREWVLGQMPGERGAPVKILKDQVFSCRETAEWEVFKRRWKMHMGEDLE